MNRTMPGIPFALVVLSGLVSLLMVGCASHSYPGYKAKPYTIRGVRYYPLSPQQAVGFREEGIASWYDERRFLSRGTTALGEPFRAGANAGAHKTIPLPAHVRVTNLENGRSEVIRLNDRGPFIKGRIVDVTPSVAAKLGFKHKGLTRVRVEVLSVGDGSYRIAANERAETFQLAGR